MLPILYQSPEFILYSYPLLMGLGWGVAYQIFFGLMDHTVSKITSHVLYWGIFLSAWVGSKVLFYLTMPAGSEHILNQSSFWLGGGFVFYGGLLAGMLFLLIYRCLGFPLTEKNFWPVLPALTFGHAIGRIGCLLAGCCFGKETDFFWGIHLHGVDRHPTQIIEAAGLFILGFHLLKSRKSKSHLLVEYFIFYGVLRFLVETLRGDLIRGLWWAFTPSQWISLFLILGGLGLWIYLRKSNTLRSPQIN